MIRSGDLDTVVQFQAFTNTVDSTGSPTQTWAALSGAPTRAKRMPLKGTEMVESGKLSDKEMIKLKIRRDSRLVTSVRVVTDGKNYDIASTQDYGRDGDMILWCEYKSIYLGPY